MVAVLELDPRLHWLTGEGLAGERRPRRDSRKSEGRKTIDQLAERAGSGTNSTILASTGRDASIDSLEAAEAVGLICQCMMAAGGGNQPINENVGGEDNGVDLQLGALLAPEDDDDDDDVREPMLPFGGGDFIRQFQSLPTHIGLDVFKRIFSCR